MSEVIRLNFRTKARGQALVIVALAIVGLAGIAGLVIDGGNAFLDRRTAQNAADTAALTAAVTRVRGGENMVAAALSSAAENGYDNNGTTNTVEIHTPPISGPAVAATPAIAPQSPNARARACGVA